MRSCSRIALRLFAAFCGEIATRLAPRATILERRPAAPEIKVAIGAPCAAVERHHQRSTREQLSRTDHASVWIFRRKTRRHVADLLRPGRLTRSDQFRCCPMDRVDNRTRHVKGRPSQFKLSSKIVKLVLQRHNVPSHVGRAQVGSWGEVRILAVPMKGVCPRAHWRCGSPESSRRVRPSEHEEPRQFFRLDGLVAPPRR